MCCDGCLGSIGSRWWCRDAVADETFQEMVSSDRAKSDEVRPCGRCHLKSMRCGSTALLLVVMFSLFGVAQDQSSSPAAAPIPQGIMTAKKVFISNAGADSGLFPHPFSGSADRAYNQFYSAVGAIGRYELVANPAEADLVLQLRLTAPYGPTNADKQKGASDPLPMFRLEVIDAKTHFVLWALTQSIERAALQKTHDHNFDVALTAMVDDFKRLSATGTTGTP